jgi:hypothetical protein
LSPEATNLGSLEQIGGSAEILYFVQDLEFGQTGSSPGG